MSGPERPARIRPGPAAESFAAHFTVPDAGWIRLRIPDLIPDGTIDCSEVFDPFPDMVQWLEAICRGEPHAIWEIDEEGSSALLIYHADVLVPGGDGARLILCRAGHEVWRTAAMAVTPRAVVAALWSAFRAMVTDPAYSPREWEMPEHEPAITFDICDPRWDLQCDERWRASEAANPFSGVILRFLESELIETTLADPEALRDVAAIRALASRTAHDAAA